MTLYRHILKQAWETTWRYKYLWFFGLFAAFLGNAGELDYFWRALNNRQGDGLLVLGQNFIHAGIFSGRAGAGFAHFWGANPFSLFFNSFILALIIIFGLFFVWLAVVSQIALVNSAAEISGSKKIKSPVILTGLQIGKKHFWSVAILNLLERLVVLILAILVSEKMLGGIFNTGNLALGFIYLIFFILFLIAALSFSFIIKYAVAFIVVKSYELRKALRYAWKLFWKNWLISLEMAITIFCISFLATVAVLSVFLVLAIPILFAAAILGKLFSWAAFFFLITIGIICMIVITAVLGAAVSTFQVSAWTNLFIRLIGQGGESKILRVIKRLRGR